MNMINMMNMMQQHHQRSLVAQTHATACVLHPSSPSCARLLHSRRALLGHFSFHSSSSSSSSHRHRRATALCASTSKRSGPGASSSSSSPQPPRRDRQDGRSSRSVSPLQQQQQQAADSSGRQQRNNMPGSDSGWGWLKLQTQLADNTSTYNHMREAEVIHARWAMLGVISLLLSDVNGSPFPPREMTPAALAPWGFVVLASLALLETYRLAALWGEPDFEKRTYPGKRFDPLGFTAPKAAPPARSSRQQQQQQQQSGSSSSSGEGAADQQQLPGLGVLAPWLGGLPGWLAGGWWFGQREMTRAQLADMKHRELRNGRLAMVSFVGCCMASALTGKGPITLLVEHLSDPLQHNVIAETLR